MLASCRHDVGRPGPGAFRCLLLGLALLAPARAAAADIETRDFHVTVDGKHGGDVHMTIHRQDDGTVSMQCDTDILLSYLGGLKKYVYTYRGKEVWKAGRLQRLDSTCNDDGKRYAVSALVEGEGLRVRVSQMIFLICAPPFSSLKVLAKSSRSAPEASNTLSFLTSFNLIGNHCSP